LKIKKPGNNIYIEWRLVPKLSVTLEATLVSSPIVLQNFMCCWNSSLTQHCCTWTCVFSRLVINLEESIFMVIIDCIMSYSSICCCMKKYAQSSWLRLVLFGKHKSALIWRLFFFCSWVGNKNSQTESYISYTVVIFSFIIGSVCQSLYSLLSVWCEYNLVNGSYDFIDQVYNKAWPQPRDVTTWCCLNQT